LYLSVRKHPFGVARSAPRGSAGSWQNASIKLSIDLAAHVLIIPIPLHPDSAALQPETSRRAVDDLR